MVDLALPVVYGSGATNGEGRGVNEVKVLGSGRHGCAGRTVKDSA